ncbi:MAG: DUF4112 domain-containing protein [Hyphomonadaceae bacterium]
MPNKCDGVAKLKKLEQRLDRRFSLFGVQFGTDAIVGLIPIVGDVLTSATGLYIIHQSSKLGASKLAITRMFINWGVDFAVGLIPVVGDIFDFAFKSNTKNVKLLIADLEARAVELREVNREQRLAAAA